MFQDNPNLIRLAPEIYVYKNFLSKEETLSIMQAISRFSEDKWANKDMWNEQDEIDAPKQIIQGNTQLNFLYDKTVEFFAPEYKPLPSNGVSRMLEGQSLQVHHDSPGHPDDYDEKEIAKYNEAVESGQLYDPHNSCHMVEYGYMVDI